MKLSLLTKISIGAAVVGIGVLSAMPAGAQTETTVEPETATLTVTKAVVGTPPSDASFTLHILCVGGDQQVDAPALASGQASAKDTTIYDEDIPFGAAGGSRDFVFGDPAECTVTETDDGGAISSTGPVTVDITQPILYDATITNTFAAAETTTTAPAAAAPAVEAAPAFTG